MHLPSVVQSTTTPSTSGQASRPVQAGEPQALAQWPAADRQQLFRNASRNDTPDAVAALRDSLQAQPQLVRELLAEYRLHAPANPDMTTQGDIPTLPPVPVTAPRPDQVTGVDAMVYAAMLDQFSSGPTPPLDDHEQPIGPDDPIPPLPAQDVLQTHPEFQKLPVALQNHILASPTLSNQMASFFLAGGTVQADASLGTYAGRYDPNTNTIYLDKGTYDRLMNDPTDTYHAGILATVISHEVGHFVFSQNSPNFLQGLNQQQFIDARVRQEAMGILNSMITGEEIERATGERVTLLGYTAKDVDLRPIFNSFLQHKNLDTLTSDLRHFILDYTWNGPNASDLNGDGKTNQEDRYIHEHGAYNP